MLGWHIIIYREGGTGVIDDEHTIADWRTGVRGTVWIDQLVEEGLAEQTEFNGGYPLRYKGRARDILSLLTEEETSHKTLDVIREFNSAAKGIKGTFHIRSALFEQCLETNESIVVSAWDLS